MTLRAWAKVRAATNDLFNGNDSFWGTSPNGFSSFMCSLTQPMYLINNNVYAIRIATFSQKIKFKFEMKSRPLLWQLRLQGAPLFSFAYNANWKILARRLSCKVIRFYDLRLYQCLLLRSYFFFLRIYFALFSNISAQSDCTLAILLRGFQAGRRD